MNNSPKYYFLKAIEQALYLDRENSHIEFIEYIDDQMAGDEIIIVSLKNGPDKKILATRNSNGQNLKEVVKAVYGDI